MKIERHEIPTDTIEAFADKHGLVMEIYERERPANDPSRYYALFKNAEAREGTCFLVGLFGDGRTPEEAIEHYAEAISLRTLIIDAMTKKRREIKVPRLSANDQTERQPPGEAVACNKTFQTKKRPSNWKAGRLFAPVTCSAATTTQTHERRPTKSARRIAGRRAMDRTRSGRV